MTTSIKVTAHCSSDKQVRIIREDHSVPSAPVETLLQDGETNEQVVYDGWSVSVREEVRPAVTDAAADLAGTPRPTAA